MDHLEHSYTRDNEKKYIQVLNCPVISRNAGLKKTLRPTMFLEYTIIVLMVEGLWSFDKC